MYIKDQSSNDLDVHTQREKKLNKLHFNSFMQSNKKEFRWLQMLFINNMKSWAIKFCRVVLSSIDFLLDFLLSYMKL